MLNKTRKKKMNYSKNLLLSLILIVLLYSSFIFQPAQCERPVYPSPKPFVKPKTPLSVNTTTELIVKQILLNKPDFYYNLFLAIPYPDLVVNASIRAKIMRLPDNDTGLGVVSYMLTYPNGTTHNYGVFNASWYSYHYPFIYPDWDGWRKYFYAWKEGNVTEPYYMDYSNYNYEVVETKDYVGIVTNKKPITTQNVYNDTRIWISDLRYWFDKETGALVYFYLRANDSIIYHNASKPPSIFGILLEVYAPGLDFSQINPNTKNNSENNHVFNLPILSSAFSFIILVFSSVIVKVLVKRKVFRTNNRV